MSRLWFFVGFLGLIAVWRIGCTSPPGEAVEQNAPLVRFDYRDAGREASDGSVSADQFSAHSQKLMQLVIEARTQGP